jgi:hypothetical protein
VNLAVVLGYWTMPVIARTIRRPLRHRTRMASTGPGRQKQEHPSIGESPEAAGLGSNVARSQLFKAPPPVRPRAMPERSRPAVADDDQTRPRLPGGLTQRSDTRLSGTQRWRAPRTDNSAHAHAESQASGGSSASRAPTNAPCWPTGVPTTSAWTITEPTS